MAHWVRPVASALLVATLFACGHHARTIAQSAPKPTLVFSDEFDQAGPPDPTKWGYELGHIRNEEAQFYTSRPENVRVAGGNLVIEARKEDDQGYRYTSASLNTRDTFELLYGRVEVRAKIPTGVGAWPAIWMLGVNRDQVGWPKCGEIDIMENVGFDPKTIHGTIHTDAYNHLRGTQKTATVALDAPWEDFHVYAMDWSADRIEVSIDGRVYFTFKNDGAASTPTWPFDKPQYLLLNLAIGGSWGGQKGIDAAGFPKQYLIDYVRIYQQK